MHHLADVVISQMARAGAASFNGLHLRIEADAGDWGMLMGGEQVSLIPA